MAPGKRLPDSGAVRVGGANVWEEPAKAKAAMGVVPQELAIYEELSAEENLKFWGQLAGLNRHEAAHRSDELLQALSLQDRKRDALKTYSGGMKRRVNLACALMHRPKLLLLDEPTVGIDPQARSNILEFVLDLARTGTAILYTTHYLEEAEGLCHRIGIIDHGQLLVEGTLSDLKSRLGDEHLFLLEGSFPTSPDLASQLKHSFRVIRQTESQMIVAAPKSQDPSECMRKLLQLPLPIQNLMMKQPTLNDVFLQLTGRELRE
jgi:ABC-2 type transport system ATP-binding protein